MGEEGGGRAGGLGMWLMLVSLLSSSVFECCKFCHTCILVLFVVVVLSA